MKNLNNISQRWRKLTAILLLLNFAAITVTIAFPQKECNIACEINTPMHECNSDAMEMEDTCCDMGMNPTVNSSTTAECEMEFSDISCELVVHGIINSSYIIPKTIDNKVEFVQFAIIDLESDNSNIELFDLIQELSFESKPPIYLTISSFLN